MDKQTVAREMKSYVNGSSYITVPKLARHLGKRKEYAYEIVNGLDKIPGAERGTMYFIPDVAERIIERSRR